MANENEIVNWSYWFGLGIFIVLLSGAIIQLAAAIYDWSIRHTIKKMIKQIEKELFDD